MIGNIVRNSTKTDKNDYKVHLYAGSGKMGACFDEYGLMNLEYVSWVNENRRSNTVLMHSEHYIKGTYGIEQNVPLGRLCFQENIPTINPNGYEQICNIENGIINTHFTCEGCEYNVTSYFNTESRDIMAVHYDYVAENCAENLVFKPQTFLNIQYDNILNGDAQLEIINDEFAKIYLSIGGAKSVIYIKIITEQGKANLVDLGNGNCGINFSNKQGKHLILIGSRNVASEKLLEHDINTIDNRNDYLNICKNNFKNRWGTSKITLPDIEEQEFFNRSIYYILCSYSPDNDCISPPNGWTGNGWGFHFAQDFSYILPALLSLGHYDIAKAKLEFYYDRIKSVKELTKRIYGLDGTMWCWEFPISKEFHLFNQGSFNEKDILGTDSLGNTFSAPNNCQFEIHNSGYIARMAYETALFLKDDKWSKKIAWELVKECATFYNSALKIDTNGTYSIHITPSMGQDEIGGYNEKNYLCSLYSAKYSLQTAVKMAEQFNIKDDLICEFKEKLDTGLSFVRLISKNHGIYLTNEKLTQKDEMPQIKHPVMLNPLIFLPLPEEINSYVLTAYKKRMEICSSTKNNISAGWTLAAFWLASSRLGEGNAMLSDMKKMQDFNYTDTERLQITESSNLHWMQYYTTSHGLYIQAIINAIITDFDHEVKIGKAIPSSWNSVQYENIHLSNGVYSGQI